MADRRTVTRFQSALRINGPLNGACWADLSVGCQVSIRLADQWPFEPLGSWNGWRLYGCVSIRLADQWPFELQLCQETGIDNAVSIRLADQWPFELETLEVWESNGGVSIRLADQWPFEPERPATTRSTWMEVSIRLADQWPFELSMG